MSARIIRDNAIIPQTPAADYSSKRGYLVTFASGTATVSSSATTVARGVILEGNDTTAGYATEKVSIAVLGAVRGTIPMRLSGTVAAGDLLIQSTDGTVVTDTGSGSRVIVGVALQAGVTGENIEVASITPYTAS
jgi:hypothetical protein